MPIYIDLFLTFAKIGLFTFGGGYAMIALIENTCVENKKWLTHDEMVNMTVLAESTPGPIAVNCATYVGYKRGGFIGSVCGTVGMILPSFLIIYLIAVFLENFLEIAWIAAAFKGIKAAVGVLIIEAGINMFRKMKKKKLSVAIVLISLVLEFAVVLFSLKFSSITLMLIAAAVSLIFSLCFNAKGGEKK